LTREKHRISGEKLGPGQFLKFFDRDEIFQDAVSWFGDSQTRRAFFVG
jgi:hypothetical protein